MHFGQRLREYFRRPARDGERAATAVAAGDTSADAAAGQRSEAAAPADPAFEARVQALGRAWLATERSARRSRSRAAWTRERMLDWTIADPAVKAQLFRFVDVFPSLRTPEQVCAVLAEYLSQPGVEVPAGMGFGLRASRFAPSAASAAIVRQIQALARTFIAGRDPASALTTLRARWDDGVAFSIDLLGEACVSELEARAYRDRVLATMDLIATSVASWPEQPALSRDITGTIPRGNLSIKVSSLDVRAHSIDMERAIARLAGCVAPILERARERDIFVNFDMEQRALKDVVLELFARCWREIPFSGGLALQAYLRSADADAERMIALAHETGRAPTVRLVKGAYWDYETLRAGIEGWPSPVWSHKFETDLCFERLTRRLVAQLPRHPRDVGVKLALGSHNVRSIAVALASLERAGLPAEAIELQMLYGMADVQKRVARERGLRVREYVPVGELIPGMAYLVRRLLENTSNESWLLASSRAQASPDVLLAPPAALATDGTSRPLAAHGTSPQTHSTLRRVPLAPGVEGVADGQPFYGEPLRDMADPRQRAAFADAVARAKLPRLPADVTAGELGGAIARAEAALPSWSNLDAVERARRIAAAAASLRARRDSLAGAVIRDNGKGWRDADAEVCEAIDFCEYYARLAPPLFAPRRLGTYLGEHDVTSHRPRGVAAVIAPWNFPLAIPCGMVTAALVTGNTVLLKPAEQTVAAARLLVETLWSAGVPRDVLQLVPGQGETVGAALVRDPRVAIVMFTGSAEVGLELVRAASDTSARARSVKRVVCEMGGKNAIIVDSTADLDEAVIAVRDSAFGFQGQKCSACSRAIVLADVHDTFLERLIEATRSLVIGDPVEPDTDFGPLIDEAAAEKVRVYIEIGMSEGKLELAVEPPLHLELRLGRPVVGPHIFSSILPEHRLAQEEIFGPVLAVMCAPDLDTAIAWANHPSTGLTGGVMSRTPSTLLRAQRELRVGNLYLNRGITGARVGRQPFGGVGLSGVGAQAGGPAYLRQLVDPLTVCENTIRRGFSPEPAGNGSESAARR